MLLNACLSRLCRACLFGCRCLLHVLPCLTCLLVLFVLCLLCMLVCLDCGDMLPLSKRFTARALYCRHSAHPQGQLWDLNPRPFGPAPEAGALDRSAKLPTLDVRVPSCSGYGAEFVWAVAECGMRNSAEFCQNCFGLVVPWGSLPMPGGMFYDLYRAWSMPA